MKLALLREVQRARADKQPVAVVTDLGSGAQGLVYADGLAAPDLSLTAAQVDAVRTWLRTARSGTLGDSELFVRSYVPDYRLLIVGAVHIAQALAALALECGYQVTVIDPRRAFATAARFGDVELCTQWPDEAMARLAPDAQTAVVTLAHDPKIDDHCLPHSIATRSISAPWAAAAPTPGASNASHNRVWGRNWSGFMPPSACNSAGAPTPKLPCRYWRSWSRCATAHEP